MYLLAILLMFISTSWGFVEKLAPGFQGGIPCHGIGATLFDYAVPGGPPPAVLGSRLQREWVPGGWSEQDTNDNAALIALFEGLTQIERYVKVHQIEYACLLWEMGMDEFDSAIEFRARIGLPPAP